MLERFSRSWSLIKASAQVLQKDKELMVFPLCSAIAVVLVALSFILPMFASGHLPQGGSDQPVSPVVYLWAFLFYFSQYFVIFFFNTALVGAAMIRLNGGDPTVADGFRIARMKVVPILGYAAIAATIGLILRMIEEKAGWIGKIVVGLIGLAFTVATFLVVPVLVTKNIGPIDAVKESAQLLKKTWGENIIGNSGLGLVFALLYVVLGVVAVGLFVLVAASKSVVLMAIIGTLAVVAFMLLSLVHASLQGIYAAALYRYCTDGNAGEDFSVDLMQDAFKIKA